MSRFFRRRPAQDEPGRLAAGQPGPAGTDGSGGSASASHAPGEPGTGTYSPAGSASAGYGSAGQEAGPGGYRAPGYAAGGHAGPGYGQAGQGAPNYGQGGQGAPSYGQAGQAMPDSSQSAPGYGQSGHAMPGHGQGSQHAPGYGHSGQGAAGYGHGTYGTPGGYGQPGYAQGDQPGYAQGGPGAGWGAYGAGGPAAYSAGAGYGAGGYGGYDSQGGGSQRWWQHRAVLAGVSVVAAGTLAFAGLGVADAFGSSTLTTAQITQKVSPGLVDIVSSLGFQQAKAAGTGMVLTSNGEVLTNNHVIDGATSIKATDIGNGRTYTAKVVGYSKTNDVAVLKLVGASGLDTVALSSQAAQVGDKVVALGNAGGKGGAPSVVTGKVTGLDKTITASDETAANAEQLTDMTRTNANIQPGDSGGPLVNRSGEVIGMNTAASSGTSMTSFQQGGQQQQTEAFAIPVSKADSIADQITAGKASGTVHIGGTAFLGVQVSSGAGSTGGFGGSGGTGGSGGFGGGTASNGATIAGVVQGSAAAQAGLSEGDTITSVAGHAITSPDGISSVLHNYHPGDKVSIGWTDQMGQSHTATVTLGNGPAD
jgi:S1-C subfamily serine protease